VSIRHSWLNRFDWLPFLCRDASESSHLPLSQIAFFFNHE